MPLPQGSLFRITLVCRNEIYPSGLAVFSESVVVEDKEKNAVIPKSKRQPIKDWPTTERPREKLLQLGPEGLSDGELLAVLLRIGKSGLTAEDMGRRLKAEAEAEARYVEDLRASAKMLETDRKKQPARKKRQTKSSKRETSKGGKS